MNADETLKLINKQWATTTDITKIGCCGRPKAVKIKKQILDELGENFYVPNGQAPMDKVIEYFHINISYLKKLRELNKGD